MTLIRLALVGTWRHYTPGRASSRSAPLCCPAGPSGPARLTSPLPPPPLTPWDRRRAAPAPTWPLFLSVVTYLIRTNATLASQKRTGDPARAPESRAHLVGLAQVKTALDKFVVNNDNLEDAVVKEVDLPVRQRPLGGLLRDLAAQETGQRQLKVRCPRSASRVSPNRTDPLCARTGRPNGPCTTRSSPRPAQSTASRATKSSCTYTAALTSASASARTAAPSLPSRESSGAEHCVRHAP